MKKYDHYTGGPQDGSVLDVTAYFTGHVPEIVEKVGLYGEQSFVHKYKLDRVVLTENRHHYYTYLGTFDI